MIGLSGLITPSLDEMVHVAREMERQGFHVPLLIGGATTSRKHTAVKIAPAYSEPTVHVQDASRAVGVASQLRDPVARAKLADVVRVEYAQLRERHETGRAAKKLLTLTEARAKAPKIDWASADIPTPAFTGIRVLDDYPLEDLAAYIDWTPFFHTWELRGVYPKILDDPRQGEQARKLFEDAQVLLKRIIDEKLLTARAVYGFFPAASDGEDILVYGAGDGTEENGQVVRDTIATGIGVSGKSHEGQARGPAPTNHRDVLATLHTLRQQQLKANDQPYVALADWIAPTTSGRTDHIGAFAVSTGFGLDDLKAEFHAAQDDYSAILAESLADRLAEAFAERLHQIARVDWGYEEDGQLKVDDLLHERYRGIRPAPGYPAQPDHTEKRTLWQLLDVEARTGIRLTESFAMWPASAVSGFYFAHPDSHYFAVGLVARDQAEDYARRKGITVEEAERWLGAGMG